MLPFAQYSATQNASFRALRNLSIKAKLLVLATTSVAIALLLAFAGLATIDIRFIKQSKVDQLQSQAKMLSFNCAGVLTFQDKTATQELLASMEMYPSGTVRLRLR